MVNRLCRKSCYGLSLQKVINGQVNNWRLISKPDQRLVLYCKNKKVIYGSMLKIREIYPTESLIFIAEMNNSENKIEGIGLIKNILVNS